MTPDDLLQLIRTCSLHFVREEVQKASDKDPAFYEKLVNLFSRAKDKTDKLKRPA